MFMRTMSPRLSPRRHSPSKRGDRRKFPCGFAGRLDSPRLCRSYFCLVRGGSQICSFYRGMNGKAPSRKKKQPLLGITLLIARTAASRKPAAFWNTSPDTVPWRPSSRRCVVDRAGNRSTLDVRRSTFAFVGQKRVTRCHGPGDRLEAYPTLVFGAASDSPQNRRTLNARRSLLSQSSDHRTNDRSCAGLVSGLAGLPR